MDDDQQTDSDILGRVFVWLAIVVMIIVTLPQTLGDLIARPLEPYRHKSTAFWLTWNLLRLSVPLGIIILCLAWLITYLSRGR